MSPTKTIWTRTPHGITEEEYSEFYKSFTSDWENHLAIQYCFVEGQLEFRALFIISWQVSVVLFENIKLCVHDMFIMDNYGELISNYLRVICDVGGSKNEHSPRNAHQNKTLKVIYKNSGKKGLELITKLAEDKEKYKKFCEVRSENLKLGIYEDSTSWQ